MITLRNIARLVFVVLIVSAFQHSPAASDREAQSPTVVDAPRSIAPYFAPATLGAKAPDPDGFLQRWLLLEPISKPNRTNTGFTESYIRSTFNAEYFPDQFTVVPRNGDKVTVAGEELAWHALDSAHWN